MSEGLAATAVVADLTNCFTGECDWIGTALDVVALVPGGAAVRFASQAKQDEELLKYVDYAGKDIGVLRDSKVFEEFKARLSGIIASKLSAASTAISAGEKSSSGG